MKAKTSLEKEEANIETEYLSDSNSTSQLTWSQAINSSYLGSSTNVQSLLRNAGIFVVVYSKFDDVDMSET